MNPELPHRSILWRRLDHPGHESARLFSQNDSWLLQGTAVFIYAKLPCRLDYHVVCDSDWRTRDAVVAGWLGGTSIAIELGVSADQHWQLTGNYFPQIAGCVDLDLNFSPSTNLLPIRRLNLGVGEQMEVRAAWLRFPSFELEPLVQVYRRLDETTYRYESAGGRFVTELLVNSAGFVTKYPDFWEMEGAV